MTGASIRNIIPFNGCRRGSRRGPECAVISTVSVLIGAHTGACQPSLLICGSQPVSVDESIQNCSSTVSATHPHWLDPDPVKRLFSGFPRCPGSEMKSTRTILSGCPGWTTLHYLGISSQDTQTGWSRLDGPTPADRLSAPKNFSWYEDVWL